MTKQYAENVNYWQTSRSSPDKWIERAKKQILGIGGSVTGEALVGDGGQEATYLLAFEIGQDQFRMAWPVLKPKGNNLRAARVQAATALYHEVKAAVVKAKFLGARTAFFAYLVLPDGRAASEVATPEIAGVFPPALAPPAQRGQND